MSSVLSCREYFYCRMNQAQSKEAVESMAGALTQEYFLGQRFIQKIQLSMFVGCFSDTEWGRRDSKVQLLNFH